MTPFVIPIIVTVIVLFSLLFADLIYRHKNIKKIYGSEKLKVSSAFFYLFVILIFGWIQGTGFRIMPNLLELYSNSQNYFAELLNATITLTPLVPLQNILLVITAFYVAGFWDYLFHRLISHSKPFWFTHEYHHLPNQIFIGAPGIFTRPLAVFMILPNIAITAYTMTFLYGVVFKTIPDLTAILYIIFMQGIVATINHSELLRSSLLTHIVMKPLGLASPQEHILHHTTSLQGNYSNFTIIWDRVFGTYLDPEKIDVNTVQIGLSYDRDFLQTITVGLFKIPQNLREKFQLHRYCNFKAS